MHAEVVPKITACRDKDKVKPPRWTTIRESVSVIIADEEQAERPRDY